MDWYPGHKDIECNELADKVAKDVAYDARNMEDNLMQYTVKKMTDKACWTNDRTIILWGNEVIQNVGKRSNAGESDKKAYRFFNQILLDMLH